MNDTPIYLQHDLNEIPDFELPEGFNFVDYKSGYETQWAEILVETGEFFGEQDALKRFEREFSGKKNLYCYMFFIANEDGMLVGTATAWHGTINDTFLGRLHWVNILSEYQGIGLGRPLIAKAMRRIKERHETAYLKTQQRSKAAIHLYMKMGWVPMIVKPAEKQVWRNSGYFNV